MNNINNDDFYGSEEQGSSKIVKRITIFIGGLFLLFITISIVTNILESKCVWGHNWQNANCTSPKTCTRCKITEGETLGHDWTPATCLKAKTCTRCKITEGEALGHDWTPATCLKAKTCTRCKITEGKALTHNIKNWSIDTAASCNKTGSRHGSCTICGQRVTEEIPALEHNYVDEKITKFASLNASGEKIVKCTKCNNTTTWSYLLTDKETANINLVRNGSFRKYPNITIDTAFNIFFDNPQWTAINNEVVFSGGCTVKGKSVKGVVTFNITGNNFNISAVGLDGETSTNIFDINAFIDRVYNF